MLQISWPVVAFTVKINSFPHFSLFVSLVSICCPVANL